MNSIMYTYIILFAALICFPQIATAQSSDDPVVLTQEEYDNASEQKRQEVLNNPGSYIIVKEGQKVDVWRTQEKPSHAIHRNTEEKVLLDDPQTEVKRKGKEPLNEAPDLRTKEGRQPVSGKDTEEFMNKQRVLEMEKAKMEREKIIEERENELQQKPKQLTREELNQLMEDQREYDSKPQDDIRRRR